MLEWKRRFQITTLAFSTLKAKPQDKKWNSFFFSFFAQKIRLDCSMFSFSIKFYPVRRKCFAEKNVKTLFLWKNKIAVLLLIQQFGVDCLQSSQSIHVQKIPQCSCPREYHSPMKSIRTFCMKFGERLSYRAILVAVASGCSVKMVICKIWTGALANSADQNQTPQNAASDEGLHCSLKLQEVKG